MTVQSALHHEFLQARFRTVQFHVQAGETLVGRRVVVHEYPGRDVPLTEDLGRKAYEYTVEGFLVGTDYRTRMEELITALTKPGPGVLVHPSLGERMVVLAAPARLREQFIERRGMVSFALTFIEALSDFEPVAVADTQTDVEEAADACYGSIEEAFAREFDVSGAPAWSVDSVTAEIGRMSDAISSIRDGLQFDLTSLSSLVRAGNAFKANIVGVIATPKAFALELTTLVRGIVNLFDFSLAQSQIFGSKGQAKRPLDALLPLGTYSQTRPSIPTNTPVRRQQATNQAASFALIERAAVVEAVRSSAYVPFESREEAGAVRDRLYDALDTLMLDAPDDVYVALHALRSAMVRDITARGADLAQLSSVTLPASAPALLVSYRLYGDVSQADAILARNQPPASVMHPLFVPGGIPLEVLRA